MFVLGTYSSEGDFIPFSEDPIEVFQFGKTLRDSDGMVWAVMDEYGDWVSPSMKRMGLKHKMKVVETL